MSHEETRGERAVFAKARSKTRGSEMVWNGNRVYTPGVFRSWYGTLKAASKYRGEIVNSLSDREWQGSANRWWRLTSHKDR